METFQEQISKSGNVHFKLSGYDRIFCTIRMTVISTTKEGMPMGVVIKNWVTDTRDKDHI